MIGRLGAYELLDELGRGSYGVVLRARDTRTGRLVAIKRLAGRWDEQDVARFQREAEAGMRVRHPHVAALLDSGRDEQGPWHAFELVEGQDLERTLRTAGPLPVRRVLEIGVALADALAAAHAVGVLHRDLKPANVLLDARGAPRLTDFGLARLLTGERGLTATGEVVGTPLYMAPEQAQGDRERIGPAADIYGLGALLFALLTGRPPFLTASIGDALRSVLEQPAPDPRRFRAEVDPALAKVLLRCLEKDPAARFADMGELGAALRACGGPAPTTRGWSRALAAALLACSALAAVALVLSRSAARLTPTPPDAAAIERAARWSRGLELLDASDPERAFRELSPVRDDPGVRSALARRIPDPALRRLLWLAFAPESGPLEEAALLVSKLTLHPEVDPEAHLARLDALAERLRPRLAGEGRPRLESLVELVRAEAVRGAEDYTDPANSCLDRVLDTQRGIHITCGLVLIAVGRRLGIELEGVCHPGTFLVRHPGPPCLLVDPFSARVLEPDELSGPAEPATRPLVLIRLAHLLAGRLRERDQPEAAERASRLVLALAPRDTEAAVKRAFGER